MELWRGIWGEEIGRRHLPAAAISVTVEKRSPTPWPHMSLPHDLGGVLVDIARWDPTDSRAMHTHGMVDWAKGERNSARGWLGIGPRAALPSLAFFFSILALRLVFFLIQT
jgi:hypothetical protein